MSDSVDCPAIQVTNLDFGYKRGVNVLENINMSLARGSRCLLLGDNGAGKTTLLKVLAGRHMTKSADTVMVLGRSAARDGSLNHLRSYLGGDWGKTTVSFAGHGIPLCADIAVKDLMANLQVRLCCAPRVAPILRRRSPPPPSSVAHRSPLVSFLRTLSRPSFPRVARSSTRCSRLTRSGA